MPETVVPVDGAGVVLGCGSVPGCGDSVVVGFEVAPYEARVKVTKTDDYVAFTLAEFLITEKSYPLCPTSTQPLDFTAPPVDEFREESVR